MKWRFESEKDRIEREFSWRPYFAITPHRCASVRCGNVFWLRLMLSTLRYEKANGEWVLDRQGSFSSGLFGPWRRWACSEGCAHVADYGVESTPPYEPNEPSPPGGRRIDLG